MFRNVRFYRLEGDWPATEEMLSAQLAHAAFRPCSPLMERSTGFEPITGEPETSLCRRVNGADLMRLRSQTRVLPSAALNEALEERVQQYRARMGEMPSRREKRQLKEELYAELLSQALLRSERINGFFLPSEKLLGIDAGSEAKAERFISKLRLALDHISLIPLDFDEPVAKLLHRIFLGDGPKNFILGQECVMQAPGDERSTVRWNSIDLTDHSIRKHVTDGLNIDRLAIEYDAIMSCVIDRKNIVSKIKIVGADVEEHTGADEDPLARLDAEFVLLAGTLRRLVSDIGKALKE